MKRNEQLLLDVADQIRFHPDSYEQKAWAEGPDWDAANVLPSVEEAELCGTTACVAGWAMLLSRQWKWVGRREEFRSTWRHRDGWFARLVAKTTGADETTNILDEGAYLLGMTRDEADLLFNGDMKPACAWDDEGRVLDFDDADVADALVKIAGGLPVAEAVREDG